MRNIKREMCGSKRGARATSCCAQQGKSLLDTPRVNREQPEELKRTSAAAEADTVSESTPAQRKEEENV